MGQIMSFHEIPTNTDCRIYSRLRHISTIGSACSTRNKDRGSGIVNVAGDRGDLSSISKRGDDSRKRGIVDCFRMTNLTNSFDALATMLVLVSTRFFGYKETQCGRD